ncbi:thiamine-binding protein [Kocuria varians]|uniref:thiamine-binding protein n=1 Tax=Kocuria varians TaxID=1272 RepID=UPI001143106A|nr:thiamine-binding protein [Kocuria varians]
MLIAFSVSPSGGDNPDASVHDAVAAAVHVVRESGLPNRTDSMFTTIEGEWDECMAVVKEATAAVAEYGPRVSLVLKADIRPGHTGELTGKVERLESALHSHELGRSQERRGIAAGRPDGSADDAAGTTPGAAAPDRA